MPPSNFACWLSYPTKCYCYLWGDGQVYPHFVPLLTHVVRQKGWNITLWWKWMRPSDFSCWISYPTKFVGFYNYLWEDGQVYPILCPSFDPWGALKWVRYSIMVKIDGSNEYPMLSIISDRYFSPYNYFWAVSMAPFELLCTILGLPDPL